MDLQESSIYCLSETWLLQSLNRLPNRLSNFTIIDSVAVRDKNKGRGSGGLLVIYDKNIYSINVIEKNIYWLFLNTEVVNTGQTFILGSLYFKPKIDFENVLFSFNNSLDKIKANNRGKLFVVGGDFNSKTGSLNQYDPNSLQSSHIFPTRTTLNDAVDKKGQCLTEVMEDNNFMLLNGRTVSDSPAQFTNVTPHGNSIIDLVWCNYDNVHQIYDLKVESVVSHSYHFPVKVMLTFPIIKNSIIHEKPPVNVTYKWDIAKVDAYKEYLRYCPRVGGEIFKLNNCDKLYLNLVESIYEAAAVSEMAHSLKSNFVINNKPWFDSDCINSKITVKRKYKDLKKNNFCPLYKIAYFKVKHEYKNLIKWKKQQYELNLIKDIGNSKNSQNFWKAVNKYRFKIKPSNPIGADDWEIFFKTFYPLPQPNITVFTGILHPLLDIPLTIEELVRNY